MPHTQLHTVVNVHMQTEMKIHSVLFWLYLVNPKAVSMLDVSFAIFSCLKKQPRGLLSARVTTRKIRETILTSSSQQSLSEKQSPSKELLSIFGSMLMASIFSF
jgi:hypothetical protein